MFGSCLCCKAREDITPYEVKTKPNSDIEPVSLKKHTPLEPSNDPLEKLEVESQLVAKHIVDECGDKVDTCDTLTTDQVDIDIIIDEAKMIAKNQEEKTEEELIIMAAQLEPLVKRLEAVVLRLESGSGASTPTIAAVAANNTSNSSPDSVFVQPFEDIINDPLAKYVALSNEIGAEVKEQAVHVSNAFKAQKDFIVIVGNSKKPSDDSFQKLIAPISEKLSAVLEFNNSYKSAFKNNLNTICESIPSLGWVGVSPTPAPFVKDMIEAGQFYSNRVLKEFKETDKKHVDWINAWKEVLNQLVAYIKQYHTTGLAWNPKGAEAKMSAPSGGVPPPPGPPPPTSLFTEDTNAVAAPTVNHSALFSEINKGGSVTSGLKKVTNDMKTHKNPDLRTTSTVTAKPVTASKPNVSSKPVATKPPIQKLEGKKWIIENQLNNSDIVISDTNSKQTAYIYNCQSSVIKIVGKLNSICLDNCKKTSILFDDVISSIDFVNCKSVEMQVIGKVLTINVDKTDGCKMYLSEISKNAEIITAKSSEMNVLVPQSDGEFIEYCVSEQFKTVFKNGKLVTIPTDIAS